MVMKYNQFKPLFGEIAGGFPFGGKPLGLVRGYAWGWLGCCCPLRRGVVPSGWLGARRLSGVNFVLAV